MKVKKLTHNYGIAEFKGGKVGAFRYAGLNHLGRRIYDQVGEFDTVDEAMAAINKKEVKANDKKNDGNTKKSADRTGNSDSTRKSGSGRLRK